MEDQALAQLQELARLVIATRSAQSHYFKNRTPINLRTAKQLEAQLDRFAASILTDQQPTPVPYQLPFGHASE